MRREPARLVSALLLDHQVRIAAAGHHDHRRMGPGSGGGSLCRIREQLRHIAVCRPQRQRRAVRPQRNRLGETRRRRSLCRLGRRRRGSLCSQGKSNQKKRNKLKTIHARKLIAFNVPVETVPKRKRQRPRGLWRFILEDTQLDRISSSSSAFRLSFRLAPSPVSSNSPSASILDSHRRPRPPDLPPVQPPACADCCPSGSAFQSTSNFCLPLGPPAVLSIKFQLASVLSRQRCQRLQPPTSVGYCISGFCLPANPRFASAINHPALPAINFRISSAANS